MPWLKQKKVTLSVLAIVFVAGLFFVKTKSTWRSGEIPGGLVYNGTETVEDLVNKDTDGDNLPDWEEGLLGTDPQKKDTDGNGISDSAEMEKVREQAALSGGLDLSIQDPENLTETDKLSR